MRSYWRAACPLFLGFASGFAHADESAAISAYSRLASQVSAESIERDLRAIATPSSRLAGSSGERKALEFVERRFRSLGLVNVRRESFRVTVPDPEAKGLLTLENGKGITVFPLWPCLVRTSTCDVTGKLVYGGKGSLRELSGKEMSGSIAVLEFASGANWQNAIKLGASAVLFLEPWLAGRAEAEKKFGAVPLRAPRFVVPMRSAGPLLAAAFRGERARLNCRQDWVVRETWNVLADLPGVDPRLDRERLVLSAYVDSMSVVPALSPGADSASGAAALLALSDLFSKSPLRRPVTFAAMSAHHLALQGAREFVERRFESEEAPPLLAVSLDLSSGNSGLGVFAQGWFYEYRAETFEGLRELTRVLRQHAERLASALRAPSGKALLIDAAGDGDGRSWKNNIPGRFALDCEPFVLARCNAVTFATLEDSRQRVDTPSDTVERVNFQNIARQTQTLACLLWHLGNDTSNRTETGPFRVPLTPAAPKRIALAGGFGRVEGRVVEFDPLKSFLPDVAVPDAIVLNVHNQKSLMGVRGSMVQAARGEQARFRFVGVAPVTAWFRIHQRLVRLAAFKIDPVKGELTHAPAAGLLGSELYNPTFALKTGTRELPLVVFQGAAIDLYDLSDPQDLNALTSAKVIDARSGGAPSHYGLFLPSSDDTRTGVLEDSAVVFLRPGFRWKLLMGSGLGDARLILTNASHDNPEGKGYLSDEPLRNVPLSAARDIVTLNRTRLDRFAKYRIVSPSVDVLQRDAEEALASAEEALAKRDWWNAERLAREAWGLALRVHPVVQGTARDAVNGIVFYLILIGPFSFFVERLFFGGRSLILQLSVGMAIFFASFALLRAVHPAFEIVSNPIMILVAFVMGALSLMVIGLVVGRFESGLKNLQAERTGVREVDIGRFSVAMAAFQLGLGNMRRRKARTLLTTLTLVLTTFIALSFTSMVPELKVLDVATRNPARYAGLLVRNPGLEPLQDSAFRALSAELGGSAVVSRRAWYYGADILDTGSITMAGPSKKVELRALLGMDAAESQVSQPQRALLPGGRWFAPGEENAVILPASLAAALGFDPSSVGKGSVTLAGETLAVIGIADDAKLKAIEDLDADGVLPADFALSSRLQAETRTATSAFRKFLRLDPAVCAIVPAEFALKLGGEVRSIGIGFRLRREAAPALRKLMPRLRFNIYAGIPGPTGLWTHMFSSQMGSRSSGLALLLVLMAITAVFVLNTMIASVYERRREIGIFSAVGLAPNHIATLFFAESLVYGVLGSVLGYFVAQGVAKALILSGALPELTLNFSASSAVLAGGMVFAVVILSTLVPARIAARIAAPALDQELARSRPTGDSWEIPLPFRLGRTETESLMRFLESWLKAFEEYTIGEFVATGTKLRRIGDTWELASTVWPAPYDLGVCQDLLLTAKESELPDAFTLELRLERVGGDPANWVLVNGRFLERLRRQFLTWRSLGQASRGEVSATAAS